MSGKDTGDSGCLHTGKIHIIWR